MKYMLRIMREIKLTSWQFSLLICLVAGLVTATVAGTLVDGKPLPSSTVQYPFSVNSYGQLSLAKMAGERNADSTTGTDYVKALPECKSSGEIDLSAGSGTIYNGPALICGFMISTTPGTAASSIDDNATAKIPLPVSFPVGVYQGFGTIITTSLKYTRGASATGKMVVWYVPLDTTVTW